MSLFILFLTPFSPLPISLKLWIQYNLNLKMPPLRGLQALKSKFSFKIKEAKQISLQVQKGTNLHLQW